jgi:pimeloyl-ACP methyl ester carboxylesterase
MSTEQLMFARSHGSGLPVLVIHGWEMDGRVEAFDFEPIFSSTSGFQRIYVDLPGMGSTPAGGVSSMDDIFLHLVRFVDVSIGSSRFLVVGTSCGAQLARAVANRYRGQVDGLLLRVPLVVADDRLRALDKFYPLVPNAEVMEGLSLVERELLGDVPIQTPEYISALSAKLGATVVPAIAARDAAALDPIRATPQKYSLSSQFLSGSEVFAAPSLIVCGRQDDVVGYRDCLRLLELYPRSSFAVLDRGTHGLPVDEHDVFQPLVANWLQRVKEWQGSQSR